MPLPATARRLASRAAPAFLATLVSGIAVADKAPADTPSSGKHVYNEICSACHGQGVPRAPQLGNRRQWAPLIREGQATLTAHAWVGVGGMPPRGGRADLSLEAFASGVAYMARSAGASWQAPDPALLQRIEAEVRKREIRRKTRGSKAG
ncbi:MAG: c-type cytochrome [Zoogloea sp.]|jgi:cytochrome c5|uniref:c-type cytochrome n=1 Tax=Zoogloea sp. TaxID=49181 RepID=UPI00262E848D|nr:c-type cytochrome [Zoogloea sp.]MDD3327531.1 c-type cytochrome [Zoogloea sp.]